ncbi:MAG: metal-dependent transcriptional regulator [Coriobacteriales bacterium]|jgi:Mn-dependent DtxR family transcriptional regulator|nr:metal-dependent transcriptional regulator [Coriobacteriales bacterium]
MTTQNTERSGPEGADKLSSSGEDYLEAIYQLGGATTSVRSVDLATKLDVSKASVNKAINNLKSAGLVEQPYYGDITLTEQGLRYARGVQNRHEILTEFLSQVLEVEANKAQSEACMMEHALSDETLQSWTEFMKTWKADAQGTP